MRRSRFEAPTLREAVGLVCEVLGSDAWVIAVRTRRSWLPGRPLRVVVEALPATAQPRAVGSSRACGLEGATHAAPPTVSASAPSGPSPGEARVLPFPAASGGADPIVLAHPDERPGATARSSRPWNRD